VWRTVELIAEMVTGWYFEVVFLDCDSGHCSGGGRGLRERERMSAAEQAKTFFNVQAYRSRPLVARASAKKKKMKKEK